MKDSQLYKGSLTTIILSLLSYTKRMYGYEITQQVKARTEGELNITEGALYPALHKLEAEGLITVEMETVGNRVRKYYSLTDQGHTQIAARLEDLKTYIRHMQTLINPNLTPDII